MRVFPSPRARERRVSFAWASAAATLDWGSSVRTALRRSRSSLTLRLEPSHLGRQQPVILLLPIEIRRRADPRLATDVRNRHPVRTLLQNKRFLGLRKLLGLHRPSLLPAGKSARKALTKNGPIWRPQITTICAWRYFEATGGAERGELAVGISSLHP